MRLWRIASVLFPVWSGEGARLKGGRWNRPGTPAIYAATSFASALLETLVHLNIGRVPPEFRYVEVHVPDDVRVDRVAAEELPGWDDTPAGRSVEHGDLWLRSGQGLVLLVPSAVTGGLDQNAMVNPLHADFARVTASAEQPVHWDARLIPAGITLDPFAFGMPAGMLLLLRAAATPTLRAYRSAQAPPV